MTVAQHALAHALDAGRHTIVVTGAVELDLAALDQHPNRDKLIVIHNPEWRSGQASSLRAATTAAAALGADAIVVGLADQPLVSADSWDALARSSAQIAVATYDGQRRNPVRLHRSVWDELPNEGDFGARMLIALSPERVQELPCTGSAIDIDTLEELETWQSRS